MTYNQISQTMKLYVYPAKNQSKQKQKEMNLNATNGQWSNPASIR